MYTTTRALVLTSYSFNVRDSSTPLNAKLIVTLQIRGNTSKTATIDSPEFLAAKDSMLTTFQHVLNLQPNPSLFPWKTVSGLPTKLLQKAIDKMQENASTLKPPLSSDKISDLQLACITFSNAYRQCIRVKNARHSPDC